jgi:hypothetical protein
MILDAISKKLTSLNLSFVSTIKYVHKREQKPEKFIKSSSEQSEYEIDSYLDLGHSQPIHSSAKIFDVCPDIIKGIWVDSYLVLCVCINFST